MTNHLQLLKERIQQNKIAIFVGAGISTNAGMPDWNGLMDAMLESLATKDPLCGKYQQGIKDGILTPIEVLGKIESLKDSAVDILYKKIKSSNTIEPTTTHSKIGKLSDQILTTNYDDLLERANGDFEIINYTNTFKIAKLSETPKYIFKIHGDIEEPHNCILFPSQYQELYSAGDKASIFEVKKIISDKSILFIGFSLNDPYVKYIFVSYRFLPYL